MGLYTEYGEKEGILRVKVTGQWDDNDLYKFVDEVYGKSVETNMEKIFIDMLDLSAPPKEISKHFVGLRIAKVWSYKIKVAVFAQKEKITYFGENTANNRGARMRAFYDEKKAMAWLKK